MAAGGAGDRPSRARRVQVGPFRLAAPTSVEPPAADSRSGIAGRYRRHLRGVARGRVEVSDPDESVRKVVSREVRKVPGLPGPGAGLSPRLGRGTDEDDDG